MPLPNAVSKLAAIGATAFLCGAPAATASAATAAARLSAEPPTQRQLIDRIVAVVDGEVITLAQLQRAVRLSSTELGNHTLCGDLTQANDDGANASAGSEANADAAAAAGNGAVDNLERRLLDCMIDTMLVDRYVRRFAEFADLGAEVDRQLADLVARFPSVEAFEQELERQGMSADEVRYDLQRRYLISNYIDVRYRQTADIRESDSRRYYEEVFRPEMERIGETVPPFESVEHLIRPILIENEVNRRVDDWLADLRRRADIVVYLW